MSTNVDASSRVKEKQRREKSGGNKKATAHKPSRLAVDRI